jgi:hypothetical protein
VTPPKNSPALHLQCHPAAPAGATLGLTVAVSVTPTGLQLVYRVAGSCAALRIPPATQPGPADGLWRHTCMEAFVAVEGDAAYREFNFSPSGQWAIYSFAGERVRTFLDVDAAMQPSIQIQIQSSIEQLTLAVHLPWSALPARGSMLNVALSAVIEEVNGRLSYWARQHPGEQPDFHHPAGRDLRLALPEN